MGKINVKYSSGHFTVYNNFVDWFIKEANPSYIKVYLYILRHAEAFDDITLTKMSKDIGLIRSDIISAFKFWDEQGVITYNNDPDNIGIVILNLDNFPKKEESKAVSKENDSIKHYQSDDSVSSSYKSNVVVKTVHNDEKLAHLFSIIQQMLNKSLSSNDYKVIYSFIDYLKLPEQVIIILFEYCISLNKTNMRYIEKIAYTWADKGIYTVQAAENFIKEKNEQQSLQAYYKNKFKISGRDFTDTETKFLLTWVNEYKAGEDVILNAYERTVLNTGKVSFKYMDTIIKGETSKDKEKNSTASGKNKNYPANYNISDAEKERIQKMLAEFEDGE